MKIPPPTLERAWAHHQAFHDSRAIAPHMVGVIEPFAGKHSNLDAKDLFTQLLLRCLPKRAHGIHRTKVGYNRMCVLVYHLAPEYFEGMTRSELARHLGITERALRKQFEWVMASFAQAHAPRIPPASAPRPKQPACIASGSFLPVPSIEVPRDAKASLREVNSKLCKQLTLRVEGLLRLRAGCPGAEPEIQAGVDEDHHRIDRIAAEKPRTTTTTTKHQHIGADGARAFLDIERCSAPNTMTVSSVPRELSA